MCIQGEPRLNLLKARGQAATASYILVHSMKGQAALLFADPNTMANIYVKVRGKVTDPEDDWLSLSCP